jgi:D-alanyl-lipoteichoic acid acyltransferase DltB (MBOAT superfamily)
MSNFAGHHAPNAFRWPLLATHPIELWRRWNVHVVDFLRRAFIYEAARRNRSAIVMVFAGMAGSALYHGFKLLFIGGANMSGSVLLSTAVSYLGIMGGIMLVTIPLDKYRDQFKLPTKIALGVVLQLTLALIGFVYVDHQIFLGEPLPGPGWCLLAAMFDRSMQCAW